jgi:hypothetical protein
MQRKVCLACGGDLQKHEAIVAISDFLQRHGCIITSTWGADYYEMYAAIEQCDVFISVLDEMIYGSTQGIDLLIYACVFTAAESGSTQNFDSNAYLRYTVVLRSVRSACGLGTIGSVT